MTIAYDLQGSQSVHHGERGIARYVLELALALEHTEPGLVDLFVVNPDLPEPSSLAPLRAAGRVVASDDSALERVTVFHIASPMENGIPGPRLLPVALRRRRAVVIATVYDLIPLVYEEHYLRGRQNRAEYGRGLAVLQSANELLAISHATASDAHALLGIRPERITVIGAGASSKFRRPDDDERARAQQRLARLLPSVRPSYILVPTGIDFRKNVEGTIGSYARIDSALRRTHQLVVACRVSEADRQGITALAARCRVAEDVILTDYVSDETLVDLYQLAHVVVFPSRYEGFGLPALEARQCGAPVICGDNSSLREVITDERARFDADDADDIARVMRNVLQDAEFRHQLAAADLPDFSWARAARATAAVYRRSEAAWLGHPPRRARVGIVPSPDAPPTTATIDQLVGQLGPRCDVTRFGDEPAGVLDLYIEAGVLDAVIELTRQDAPVSTRPGSLRKLTVPLGDGVATGADAIVRFLDHSTAQADDDRPSQPARDQPRLR